MPEGGNAMTPPAGTPLGHAILQRRIAAGLSLRALAAAAGRPNAAGHLSRIEQGTNRPSPELAASLDQALGAKGSIVRLTAEARAQSATEQQSKAAARGTLAAITAAVARIEAALGTKEAA
jgi:transcriptional regulator with XRE-family HTH domain